jgi:hypothetical protein
MEDSGFLAQSRVAYRHPLARFAFIYRPPGPLHSHLPSSGRRAIQSTVRMLAKSTVTETPAH